MNLGELEGSEKKTGNILRTIFYIQQPPMRRYISTRMSPFSMTGICPSCVARRRR